jgi:hypothetical protein
VLSVVAVAVLAAAHGAAGGIVIDVGTHYLEPNLAGQTILIRVSTTDGNRVGGCDLNVQVDGGGPPQGGVLGPAITAVNLESGTIFAGNNTGQNNLGSFPQLALYSIVTSSGTVGAGGLLATLTVDTTGFRTLGQSWTLQLGNTLNGPTDFAPIPAAITDGKIVIDPGIRTWVVGAGNWEDANSWDIGVPNAHLEANVANGGVATVREPGAACSELDIGVGLGKSGTVIVGEGASLTITGSTWIGTGSLILEANARVTAGNIYSSGNIVVGPGAVLYMDELVPFSDPGALAMAFAEANVPEPATAAVLIVGGLVLARRRRR